MQRLQKHKPLIGGAVRYGFYKRKTEEFLEYKHILIADTTPVDADLLTKFLYNYDSFNNETYNNLKKYIFELNINKSL